VPETRDPTNWPGAVLDADEKASVLKSHGAEHVGVCERCGKDYFMRTSGKSPVCWGCWYGGELDSYEDAYADVFEALRKIGLEPSIAQTGGMCMTIHVPLPDGYYFWLTDRDDTLSFERRLEDGWTLGVYAGWDEDSDGMPLPVFDGEDYLSVDFKSADFAVGMARIALDKLEEHLS
jgi:hypothetical protein